MLDVASVTVSFGGVKALEDVTFRLESESVGIVGANGAGKTTLLNAISGLAKLRSGHIYLDNHELTSMRAPQRVQLGVGRSFQHPMLMEALTLEENLCAGRSVRRSGVVDIAHVFGLAKWMMRPIGELPYGIRKVADLARAAMLGQTLLLCDEPFSGLDETGRDEMSEVLRTLREEGRTLVIIEHDIGRVSSLVDRFVVMDFGKVIFDGAPNLAMGDRDVQSALVGLVV